MRVRAFVLLTILAGCRTAGTGADTPNRPLASDDAAGPIRMSLEEVGLSEQALDRSTDPCQDFYRFACGGWLDSNEIPADRPSWNRGFNTVREQNLVVLHEILEEAAAAEDADPVRRKVGDYYAACMDEPAIEAKGLSGAAPLLESIGAIRTKADVVAAITELHRYGIFAGFDVSADQHYDDATRIIAFLDQNGLGLPDRDYYLNEDAHSKELRETYEDHVRAMLELAGGAPEAAARGAADVLALETALAKASMTRVERRDPPKIWHEMSVAELGRLAPHFAWEPYLAAQGLKDVAKVNVMTPDFFRGLDRALVERPISAWKSYLTWNVVSNLAASDALPMAFVNEHFRMFKAITGQPTLEPRWKRCVADTSFALGELVGRLYVDRAFSGESKPAAERMVKAISAAFGRNLATIDWMDDETRALARAKIEAMHYKIGYPDVWRTYPFEVTRTDYAGDTLAARISDHAWAMSKIGKPLDTNEWLMMPSDVNAYYSGSRNEMAFPAGILQPPFYSVKAATAVNLGGIGMVMGHELTHGFDDEGSQFDARGNLKNWWSSSAAKRFEAKGRCVVDRYAKYSPLEGVTLDGELTLGENIADIGGVKIAFNAYRDLREGERPLTAGGFSEDQLFFLGFAQSWCSKRREGISRMLAKVDPHSPPRFRVDGSLPNVEAFAEAFQCKAGTPMHPTERCQVW